MRSSFLPKCQPKITKISALEVYQRIEQKSEKLLVGILGETITHKFILNLTDLYPTLLFKINVAKINHVWKFYRGLCSYFSKYKFTKQTTFILFLNNYKEVYLFQGIRLFCTIEQAEKIIFFLLFHIDFYAKTIKMHVIYFAGFYDIIAIVAGVVQTILYADFFYLYITKVRNSVFRKSIISNRLSGYIQAYSHYSYFLFLLHSILFCFLLHSDCKIKIL